MIPCETFPLFEPASQLVSCDAGEVRSTSTGSHVKESDGSCTSSGRKASFETIEESEASLERGIDEYERHTKSPERVRECMGISFWKGLQGESCGTRGERPCQTHQQQVWETTEVKQRSGWEILIPQDRD